MQLPEGATQPRRTDNTLVKALARAFRWKRMLESGEFATIAELAEREGIAPSYMTRVLRLTLLAPDIVEAILEGKQGPEVTLARVLEPFPMEWSGRRTTSNISAEAAVRDRRGDRPYEPVCRTPFRCRFRACGFMRRLCEPRRSLRTGRLRPRYPGAVRSRHLISLRLHTVRWRAGTVEYHFSLIHSQRPIIASTSVDLQSLHLNRRLQRSSRLSLAERALHVLHRLSFRPRSSPDTSSARGTRNRRRTPSRCRRYAEGCPPGWRERCPGR